MLASLPWLASGHVGLSKVRKMNLLLRSLPENTLSVFGVNELYHWLVVAASKLLIVLLEKC